MILIKVALFFFLEPGAGTCDRWQDMDSGWRGNQWINCIARWAGIDSMDQSHRKYENDCFITQNCSSLCGSIHKCWVIVDLFPGKKDIYFILYVFEIWELFFNFLYPFFFLLYIKHAPHCTCNRSLWIVGSRILQLIPQNHLENSKLGVRTKMLLRRSTVWSTYVL